MKWLLLLVLCLGTVGMIWADCPTVVRRVVPSPCAQPAVIPVVTPVVEVPVYTPILVPAYSFQFLPAVAPTSPLPTYSPGQPPAISTQEFWPSVPAASASAVHPAVTLLAGKCARCHTSPAKAGVDLFAGNGEVLPTINRNEIQRVVSQHIMPPAARRDSSQALSAQELALVQQWVAQP